MPAAATSARRRGRVERVVDATNDAPRAPAPSSRAKRALRFGEIPASGKLALALLALQFASEPHFRELSHRVDGGGAGGEGARPAAAYNPMSAVVITELLKIALCTFMLALGPGGAEHAAPSAGDGGLAGRRWRIMAGISLLYALQDWYAARCYALSHIARQVARRAQPPAHPPPARARHTRRLKVR